MVHSWHNCTGNVQLPIFTSMDVPGFRPRFRFESDMDAAMITDRIGQRLQAENPRKIWAKNTRDHVTLAFQPNGAEAWTPEMDLSFEALENGNTMVRCLIGPSPGIWMLFAGGYLALILLGLTAITLGVAQLMLKHAAWGFYLVPVVVLGIGVLFYLERTGRRRARSDMHFLKDFVDKALGCDCLKLAEEQAH